MSLIVDVCMGALGAALFGVARRFWPKRAVGTPERCTGYMGPLQDFHSDCRALRNPFCGDGRCSFHCSRLCRCAAANEPEFVGRPR